MKFEKYIQNGSGLAGVFQVPHAAMELYYCLHALQHRGSDGVGLAAADGSQIHVFKELGMLSESVDAALLESLEGTSAIGHVRMAMEKDLGKENIQPIRVRSHQGSFAIVFCGCLVNGPSLREQMEKEGLIFQGLSDGELIAHLIQIHTGTLQEKIQKTMDIVKGPCTFLVMTKNTMYAVRSGDGIRSLYMGRLQEGYIFASETAAFSIINAKDIREVAPGEMIVLGKNGYSSKQIQMSMGHPCAMESVYYSRPDSKMGDHSVHWLRQQAGKRLAQKETVEADIVIGVPDTALCAAAAFAQELKKPYEIGLIKNRYIGSTFIQPTQQQREQGMRVRLNAISSIIKGKRVYLIDDSIQKGLTSKRLCQLLKEAGASEVHLRIASPPIRHSCFYGTEYIRKKDLCAAKYTVQEMKELFGADSLAFLGPEEFASILPPHMCMACFDGRCPVELGDFDQEKNTYE